PAALPISWCTLSLSLPRADPAWVQGFLDGFLELAAQHGIALVGGDTTRGPLAIGITAIGHVEAGAALRRDRARAGEDIWVTGTLGDAAAALVLGGHLPAPAGVTAYGVARAPRSMPGSPVPRRAWRPAARCWGWPGPASMYPMACWPTWAMSAGAAVLVRRCGCRPCRPRPRWARRLARPLPPCKRPAATITS